MNEGCGESGEGLGSGGGESQSESQGMDQVRFLESLVTHYESLVQDMSTELISCRNDMKNYIEKDQTSSSSDEIDGGYNLDDLLRTELSRRDTIIEYLREQLQISSKSKRILKTLWQSTLHQIEVLEVQQTNKRPLAGNTSNVQQLGTDFLTKWKLLQSYSASLEDRLEKSTKEKNFYRNKIMEIRLEYETVLKRQGVEKSREIQQAKSSYSKEIEYLRSSLERKGQEYRKCLEKRLVDERESWEYQETTRLQSIILNVEQLALNNEALIIREAELTALVSKLEAELHVAKICHSQQEPFLVSTPVSIQSPIKRFKAVQTDFDYIHQNQFEKLKTSKQQLETEYQQILAKLKVSENESLDRRNRLQTRIQQLESLNANLQNQIIHLDNQNRHLQKRLKDQENKVQKLSEIKREEAPNSLAIVPTIEQPFWKEDFIHDNERIEHYKQDIKIMNLNHEIKRLHEDRIKLLEVIEKQRSITSKWKAEFKDLAKRSIS